MTVRISDGGKSENLGALTLLLREHQTVVILDSEHDFEFEFGALVELKRRLHSMDIQLKPQTGYERWKLDRDIEAGLPHSVITTHSAKSKSSDHGKLPTRVVYAKLGFPRELDAALQNDESFVRGSKVHEVFLRSTSEDAVTECESLSSLGGSLQDWLRFSVLRYGAYAKRDTFMTNSTSGISYVRSDFPQYTTFDQSYYLDQALGFIALGYFIGKEAAAAATDKATSASVAPIR